MKLIYPTKLRVGDTIRVIAPSCALSTIDPLLIEAATKQWEALGLRVTWGSRMHETDIFECASIESRVADLHDAFQDSSVQAIVAVRGGWNANQLLDYIDWDLIRRNPKVFCGFSDITVLQNAMLAQAQLVTYSGPNFNTLGKRGSTDYTAECLTQCLFRSELFVIQPSAEFIDNDLAQANPGWQPMQSGKGEGRIVGGNLCSFNLLHGTKYMPDISDSILFLEEDSESTYKTVDRDFQSILHLPGFDTVRGIVLGRFQDGTNMTAERLKLMITRRPELAYIPILANVDFGHTEPKVTFPIGGQARLTVQEKQEECSLEVLVH